MKLIKNTVLVALMGIISSCTGFFPGFTVPVLIAFRKRMIEADKRRIAHYQVSYGNANVSKVREQEGWELKVAYAQEALSESKGTLRNDIKALSTMYCFKPYVNAEFSSAKIDSYLTELLELKKLKLCEAKRLESSRSR